MKTDSIVSLIIVVSILGGCHSVTAPQSGIVAGHVRLFDNNRSLASDLSGVSVSVEGTALTATTNALGEWRIDSIPAGNKVIDYVKAGYAFWKSGTAGDGSADTTDLFPSQSGTVTLSDATHDASAHTTTITGVASGVTEISLPFCYFSKSSSAVASSTTHVSIPKPYDQLRSVLDDSILLGQGFNHGDTIYVIGRVDITGYKSLGCYEYDTTISGQSLRVAAGAGPVSNMLKFVLN
ncbi:MAG: hypothetical protein Q8922_06470 [Bacteroidota bacterium]|nr:hypothetical protein [Bacteroidota bacterium]MDP4233803.1 hypothetical protein [Bacteroidota bacterium]MDP4242442.1 hypothetical protein [Bacteroidota bacterium]MDP4287564.1 hypothetical protein [Bacteroidota bacterium]